MAQHVHYFEDFPQDDEHFPEGPFVIMEFNGWRIEVQNPGGKCPCLPDSSIYRLIEKTCYGPGKWDNEETAIAICNMLNSMVHKGKIIKDSRDNWIHKEN
jgi:hypothetical protein